ncbi:MAG: S41 family peptidase, partial [Cyclobacteriaceae bacterium]|nr:S41 family peptidase [Cyclobacteriaceae bacterium]
MKNKLRLFTLLSIPVIILAFASPNEKYFEIAKNLDIFATLFKEVNAYYVDEIDPADLVKTGIDAMLHSLDPYTSYIPEEEIESFRTMTTGQYAGIGAMISNIKGRVFITMPYEGFAAHRAGLKVGDEIIKIDEVDIEGTSVSTVSKLLKGQIRTDVSLIIKRTGVKEPLTFHLKREKIEISNVPYFGMVNDLTGYIKLEDFTVGAGREVKDALLDLKMKGVKNIILDLRGNPGGLLSEAVNVSNVFIPKGSEVVSTKGKIKEWNKTYKALNNPGDIEIPLIVLTDEGSASAAEIVSGVIQDYDRGLLVGRKTFGKGLVQTTRPLTYNSQLKVTTAKYYIPSGRCIQAIDYSHRDKFGHAEKIPDSLQIKFKTQNGRMVYDGSGLAPDVSLDMEYMAPITSKLVFSGIIFMYANEFYATHENIPAARDFRLTDKDYSAFVEWLKDKDYSYITKVEESVRELESSAKAD